MTRADHRVLFTALGFLAVIIRDDVPQDKPALRAAAIADLIEAFCLSEIPDSFEQEEDIQAARSMK